MQHVQVPEGPTEFICSTDECRKGHRSSSKSRAGRANEISQQQGEALKGPSEFSCSQGRCRKGHEKVFLQPAERFVHQKGVPEFSASQGQVQEGPPEVFLQSQR